jgi:hypothetical protein
LRAAGRPFRRYFLARQRLDRRAVNNGAVGIEHRSVTQAVPGALGIVPAHRTALVGAGRGNGMRLPLVILPHGELLLAVLDDAAFAGRAVRDAGNAGGDSPPLLKCLIGEFTDGETAPRPRPRAHAA